jgi:hypothetical protein
MITEKEPSVINLDACLGTPDSAVQLRLLQTFLYMLKPCVKTLSLRFNKLHAESQDYLVDWIIQNTTLEMLYLLETDFNTKKKAQLEENWKKNLTSHRTDNFGFTFIRVSAASKPVLPGEG